MPDTYVCVKCGKVAKTKQALERHAAYHEDDRPFSCEICLQRFKNSDDRGKHYRRLKKDGKYNIACTVCHKHFKSRDMLKKHIEMLGCKTVLSDPNPESGPADSHQEIDKEVEDTTCNDREEKDESQPGDGVLCTCKLCETEFSSTSCLKKHYKDVHNDIKRQVCIQCGQTLSSKDSLARHFSIFHQTTFPYHCDICNQKFKIKESLCRHVKFVHQDGGYTCPECKRVFSQPVNMKKHMAIHSKQKEYKCSTCGREFRWKQALQKHELLHNGQSESACKDEFPDTEEEDMGSYHSGENKTRLSEGSLNTDETNTSITYVCDDEEKLDIAETLTKMKEQSIIENNHVSKVSEENVKHTQQLEANDRNQLNDEYDFTENEKSHHEENLCENSFNKRKFCDHPFTVDLMTDKKKQKLSVDDNIKQHNSISTFNSEKNENDKSEVLDAEDDVAHNQLEITKLETVCQVQQLEVSALTSFPTSKKQNALPLLFKPSSIQTIMTSPTTPLPEENNILSGIQSNIKNNEEENEKEGVFKRRIPFKFPVTTGTIHKTLHNPFIIPNSRVSTPVLSTNISKEESNPKPLVPTEALKGSSGSYTNNPLIPSGKFSLVKHMLSLQNEDNFDKAIFDNPLYNKPADIKDFQLMVERHKLTSKSDDPSIERYDLSAKQNIPFNWLGMSVQRKKPSSVSSSEKSKCSDEAQNVDKSNGSLTENQDKTVNMEQVYLMETNHSKAINAHEIEAKEAMSSLKERNPPAHDRNLSIRVTENTADFANSCRKSILSNPFEVASECFMEKVSTDSFFKSSSNKLTVNENTTVSNELAIQHHNNGNTRSENRNQNTCHLRNDGNSSIDSNGTSHSAFRQISLDSGYSSSSRLDSVSLPRHERANSESSSCSINVHRNERTPLESWPSSSASQTNERIPQTAATTRFTFAHSHLSRSFSIPAYTQGYSTLTTSFNKSLSDQALQLENDDFEPLHELESVQGTDQFDSVSFTVRENGKTAQQRMGNWKPSEIVKVLTNQDKLRTFGATIEKGNYCSKSKGEEGQSHSSHVNKHNVNHRYTDFKLIDKKSSQSESIHKRIQESSLLDNQAHGGWAKSLNQIQSFNRSLYPNENVSSKIQVPYSAKEHVTISPNQVTSLSSTLSFTGSASYSSVENIEDIDDAAKFDAYSMIDSPENLSNNTEENDSTMSNGKGIGLNRYDVHVSQRHSSSVPSNRYVNHGRNSKQEVFTQDLKAVYNRPVGIGQPSIHSKSEVSVYDILQND